MGNIKILSYIFMSTLLICDLLVLFTVLTTDDFIYEINVLTGVFLTIVTIILILLVVSLVQALLFSQTESFLQLIRSIVLFVLTISIWRYRRERSFEWISIVVQD